ALRANGSDRVPRLAVGSEPGASRRRPLSVRTPLQHAPATSRTESQAATVDAHVGGHFTCWARSASCSFRRCRGRMCFGGVTSLLHRTRVLGPAGRSDMSNRDRRDFLKHSGLLAGAAGALASAVAAPAAAQTGAPARSVRGGVETQGRAVRRADRYDDSFIFE